MENKDITIKIRKKIPKNSYENLSLLNEIVLPATNIEGGKNSFTIIYEKNWKKFSCEIYEISEIIIPRNYKFKGSDFQEGFGEIAPKIKNKLILASDNEGHIYINDGYKTTLFCDFNDYIKGNLFHELEYYKEYFDLIYEKKKGYKRKKIVGYRLRNGDERYVK